MSATMTSNGRPRKMLSDQLDRLDGIIDALANALPEAVTDATRAGSREAVLEAITEVMKSPELKSVMQNLPRPNPTIQAEPTSSQPGPWTRFKARLTAARTAFRERCMTTWTSIATGVALVASVVPLKPVLAVGLVVGFAVAVVSYSCPHEVAAVVGGIAGACTAVALQVGWWLRVAARRVGVI